jgi:hypothetical protein
MMLVVRTLIVLTIILGLTLLFYIGGAHFGIALTLGMGFRMWFAILVCISIEDKLHEWLRRRLMR